MKKVITIILSALLLVCLVGCGNTAKYAFNDYTWTMTSVQSVEQNGDFVAYSPSDTTFDKTTYPNAVAIEMTCSAENGTFSIVDKTNNQTYEGTYKVMNNSSESTIYEIAIGEEEGTAVVSVTKYHDETEIPTMIISIGDYALNFQSK